MVLAAGGTGEYAPHCGAEQMLSRRDLEITAGRDLLGIGAQLTAGRDIDLAAGRDLTFDAKQVERWWRQSGWTFGMGISNPLDTRYKAMQSKDAISAGVWRHEVSPDAGTKRGVTLRDSLCASPWRSS